MSNDAELEALLQDSESDRVERKASMSDGSGIRQAICAFANDMPNHRQPGVIFVGVSDDGSCANLQITDELLRALADMRSDGNILPFPVMTVQHRRLAGCDVAVVEVQPSENPPVRYNGRIWIRVGPRRATASQEEERILTEKRLAGDMPYDQRKVQGADINNDLDLDLFRRVYLPSAVAAEVLAQNERVVIEQLASLRFLAASGTPNVASLLVLGRDPLSWIHGAYVQLVRLEGTELTDPIRHQREISGPLPELLRLIDEVLEANISVATNVTGGPVETRQPDYPIVALQQLCRNAVMHRNYETSNAPVRIYWFTDRIEIHSPGGPYGQVNEQTLGEPGVTDYRNPLVAEAMKVLGFVQRFGIGIPLARRELERNGNPELEMESSPNAVLVTLRRRS